MIIVLATLGLFVYFMIMAVKSRIWSEEFHMFAFFTFLIGSCIIGITAWWSYDSYLTMRNFYDTHETVYKGAIDLDIIC